MRIKTHLTLRILLLLSLCVTADASEDYRKEWKDVRPIGPIKTPTVACARQECEALWSLYCAGRYGEFLHNANVLVNDGKKKWLKPHIVWALYGNYLLSIAPTLSDEREQRKARKFGCYVTSDVLKHKSPGHLFLRGRHMIENPDSWFQDPIQSWVFELFNTKTWTDLPAAERILFSEQNFWTVQWNFISKGLCHLIEIKDHIEPEAFEKNLKIFKNLLLKLRENEETIKHFLDSSIEEFNPFLEAAEGILQKKTLSLSPALTDESVSMGATPSPDSDAMASEMP
jgi:hypothetical protein